MKYFITGATGFIGGHVARQLAQAGHDVIALVRTPAKAQALANAGVTLAQGDITDKASMRAPMTGVDGVFHIAGWYEVGVKDTSAAEQINVVGTRNVLELMRDLGIPKGVYTSTVGVFSDTRGTLVDESYRFTPRSDADFTSVYERTKWQAHYEVAEPMLQASLPLVIVQPALVYGPGDASLVQQTFVQYLQRKLPLAPQGATYCWSHVADTARGHILAMEKGQVGEAYIIAGPPYTMIEALLLAEKITGIPAPRLHPSPAVMGLIAKVAGAVETLVSVPQTMTAESLRSTIATYMGSDAKARRELGFSTRPLEEGLRETLTYEMQRLGIAG